MKHTWAGVEGLWEKRKCFEGAEAGGGGVRRVSERRRDDEGWVRDCGAGGMCG